MTGGVRDARRGLMMRLIGLSEVGDGVIPEERIPKNLAQFHLHIHSKFPPAGPVRQPRFSDGNIQSLNRGDEWKSYKCGKVLWADQGSTGQGFMGGEDHIVKESVTSCIVYVGRTKVAVKANVY